MRWSETDVLIAGGGPTGLAASLLLGRLGVSSLLLERRPHTSSHPKATIVNTRTMELLRQWGLEEDVRARGVAVEQGAVIGWVTRLAGRRLGEIDLTADQERVVAMLTRSPTVPAVCPQSEIEPLLRDAAASHAGSRLRFNAEVESVRCEPDETLVVVRDRATDERSGVRCRYVIGADGPSSRVRAEIGVAQRGEDRLADVVNIFFRAPLRPLLPQEANVLIWIVNPDLRGVIHALDGEHSWLLNTLNYQGDGAGGPPVAPSPKRCEELVRLAIGRDDVPLTVESVKPWTMRALMVERLAHGRVFLAGDAAHQIPPTGGFGMNTGIQDVHNLAWKLAAVLRGWASEELLDSYAIERAPVAERNLAQSVHNARLLEEHVGALDAEGLARLEAEGAEGDAARRAFAEGIEPQRAHFDYPGLDLGFVYRSAVIASETGDPPHAVGEYVPDACPGGRAPHVWLEVGSTEQSTLDLFDDRLVLLTAGQGAAWREVADVAGSRLGVAPRVVDVGPGGDAVDLYEEFLPLYGLEPGGAVLVRPDGHVAWRARSAPADPEAALMAACAQAAGRQATTVEV